MPAKRMKQYKQQDFAGRTVLSTNEAAAFLGLPPATFTHQVYTQKRIKPLRVNQRLIVFSMEQLEDYKANDYQTDMVFDASFHTLRDAAEYLGLDVKEMRSLVNSGELEPVDGVAIGGQFIYTEDELKRVAAARGWTVAE